VHPPGPLARPGRGGDAPWAMARKTPREKRPETPAQRAARERNLAQGNPRAYTRAAEGGSPPAQGAAQGAPRGTPPRAPAPVAQGRTHVGRPPAPRKRRVPPRAPQGPRPEPAPREKPDAPRDPPARAQGGGLLGGLMDALRA
jgi:hypothetical protein